MNKNFDLVKLLIDKKLTISFAESITGGLLVKYITDCPGSSIILKESYITYANESKIKILNVDNNTINKYGVVSKEVALEMAKGLKNITNSDINVSTTGNAGPTVCDDKSVGLIYYCIIVNERIYNKSLNFADNNIVLNKLNEIEIRDYIREEVSEHIINDIIEIVKNI